MRFPTWLWEQLDTGGTTARFAKLCWDDVNNGCAHPTFNASEWLSHFKEKHSDKIELLTEMLLNAYVEYMGASKNTKNL